MIHVNERHCFFFWGAQLVIFLDENDKYIRHQVSGYVPKFMIELCIPGQTS